MTSGQDEPHSRHDPLGLFEGMSPRMLRTNNDDALPSQAEDVGTESISAEGMSAVDGREAHGGAPVTWHFTKILVVWP